jgi:hypothetical protein
MVAKPRQLEAACFSREATKTNCRRSADNKSNSRRLATKSNRRRMATIR